MNEPKRNYWSDPMAEWSMGLRCDMRLRLACDIVKHCALVVGIEDGEDSQGRAKGKLLPAAQVAERSLAIAERLIELGEENGYIQMPHLTNPRMAAQYHGAFNESRYFSGSAESDKNWRGLPATVGGIPPSDDEKDR